MTRQKHKGSKRPFTIQQYHKIRQVILSDDSGMQKRNLLLVATHMNTSLRSCDLLSLKVGDLYNGRDFFRDFLIIQQKTGKPVECSISDRLKNDLIQAQKSYEGIRAGYFNDPDLPLFPSRQCDRNGRINGMSYSAYFRLLNRWIRNIGLNPKCYGTHSFRSAVPVDYYRKTNDIAGTSALFGHTNIATTEIYIKSVLRTKALEIRTRHYSDL